MSYEIQRKKGEAKNIELRLQLEEILKTISLDWKASGDPRAEEIFNQEHTSVEAVEWRLWAFAAMNSISNVALLKRLVEPQDVSSHAGNTLQQRRIKKDIRPVR